MSQRTQIYLSDELRARIDELAKQRHTTMAEIVRRALDAYLDSDDDLDASFGKAAGIASTVPSRAEWDRG
jgi:predicted transcriptional regulator